MLLISLILFILPLCFAVDPIPQQPPFPYTPRTMKDGDKLVFVQTVWRHGDRAPVMTFPTDPYKEQTWPNGWGELTPLGMRQQYALGRLLRNRYINGTIKFLSDHYVAKEVYIRSTDVNRTLVSAMANIAGMFSIGRIGIDFPTDERWPLNWTPIPVHTMALDDDHEGNVFAPCPRAIQLDEILRSTDDYLALEDAHKPFLKYISNVTGMPVDIPFVYLINDVLHIESIYNLTKPEWLTEEVSQKLRNLTEIANMYTYGISQPYTPEMIKLRGGPMLKTIVDNMMHKYDCHKRISNTTDCDWFGPLKYYAFSAHDTTIAAFLTTLGDERRVIRGGLPKYTASVAIELWELEEGPAVRILFHGAFHHNYHVITHLTKGCPENNEFCPLKTFVSRSEKFIPVDLAKECLLQKPKVKSKKTWRKIPNDFK